VRSQPDSSRPSLSGSRCPDAGLLVEHARGTLVPPEKEQITSHLEACDDCREVLALWTRVPGPSAESTPKAPAPPTSAVPVDYPPRPGDVLAGKYEVERVLGIGGMGVVLAAHHRHMARTVAIKLMLPQAMSTETTERFLREARAAAQVQGEHVARVLDVGTLEDATPFLVMEYLDGKDLARLVRERGPLPVADAVGYVLQACEALAEAHALGIVHRDLKPANLFVTSRADGSALVKVLDFGISKVSGTGARPEPSLTKSQAVMGTPIYMSPEQLRSTRSAGPATDIWALGCVLYELLAARPAFWAESPEALGALIATGPAPRIREAREDVPSEVEDVILACLDKDPATRIGTAAELARRLGPFAPREMAISVERAARISRGAPALAFADTVASDRPSSMPISGAITAQATAGSFVRSQGQTGSKGSRRAAYYVLAGFAAAAVALGLSYGLRSETAATSNVALVGAGPPAAPTTSPTGNVPASTSVAATAAAQAGAPPGPATATLPLVSAEPVTPGAPVPTAKTAARSEAAAPRRATQAAPVGARPSSSPTVNVSSAAAKVDPDTALMDRK
jgi:eukaryotic-like serine/threonine-protein kinase